MNEELMQKNLEENRFESAGIVDNIVSLGIANPILENSVRNALAKDSSAAFQYAMNNGGIYQNNTFMGGNGLYGIARKIVPKKWKNGRNYHIGNFGPFQYNKFSAGSLEKGEASEIGKLKNNIEANAPNIDTDSDIIATGFGFQNKAYGDFFNKLDSMGIKLNKAVSSEVNLTEKQYKMYKDMTYKKGFFDLPNYKRKDYSYIDDEYKKILQSKETIDSYVDTKINNRSNNLSKAMENFKKNNYDEATKKWKTEALEKKYNRAQEHLKKRTSQAQELTDQLMNEKAVVDFIDGEHGWNVKNLSDDITSGFNKKIKKYHEMYDIDNVYDYDLFNIKKVKNGKKNILNLTDDALDITKTIDDAISLERTVAKLGKSNSNLAKEYKIFSKQYVNRKNIEQLAKEHGIGIAEARTLAKTMAKDAFMATETFMDGVKDLGDDIGRIFASKTAFQKLMGNGVTKVLTGIQSGIAATAWQLPLMIATGVASTNQENSIQNFVASYLYNPKLKEMYQSAGVERSMQISQNIHMSNLQDTQSIIIKHNTAERYLNDLDPIGVDLDYSQNSFDLNPRNN